MLSTATSTLDAGHHQISIGRVERLSEDMTVRDLVEIFDQVGHRRGADAHVFLFDRGVRKFIAGLLRERLPRASLRPQSLRRPQPRVRRIKRAVSA
jgi:hypothetical protein